MFVDTLRTMVRARYPVIWITTHEENRALRLVCEVAATPNPEKRDAQKKDVVLWSASRGLLSVKPNGDMTVLDGDVLDPVAALTRIIEEVTNKPDHGRIYVMRDLHKYLGEQQMVYRFVRDAADALKHSYATLVVTSPVSGLCLEIEKDVTSLDLPLPSQDELRIVMDRVLAPYKTSKEVKLPENGTVEKVLKAGAGLTEDEFSAVLRESLVRHKAVEPATIVKVKEQIIKKSGVLDYYESVDGLNDVGGMENLKTWIQRRALAFTDKAAAFGLEPPRGLFLTGPPGTGKSLIAKATANFLGYPLLWLDPARVLSKYIGESEQKMKDVLKTADAVAPCILLLDEVEKVLAGSQSASSGDSGVTRRIFGQLLTWLNEHRSPVLVIVTCNDPLALPPEFMSRFSLVAFVDMPEQEEREQIVSIHLRKKKRDPSKFNVKEIAGQVTGFSGREIERGINEALYAAFEEGVELNTDHVIDVFRGVRPLSETRKAEIEAMRLWARLNAVPANKKSSPEGRAIQPEV